MVIDPDVAWKDALNAYPAYGRSLRQMYYAVILTLLAVTLAHAAAPAPLGSDKISGSAFSSFTHEMAVGIARGTVVTKAKRHDGPPPSDEPQPIISPWAESHPTHDLSANTAQTLSIKSLRSAEGPVTPYAPRAPPN